MGGIKISHPRPNRVKINSKLMNDINQFRSSVKFYTEDLVSHKLTYRTVVVIQSYLFVFF